jgi:hypothetical protein
MARRRSQISVASGLTPEDFLTGAPCSLLLYVRSPFGQVRVYRHCELPWRVD